MKRWFDLIILILFLTTTAFSQSDTLTIDNCIQIALENNPQMKLAQSNLDISNSNLMSSRSALFPQISLQSGWTRNGGTFFIGPITREQTYSNYSIGFQAQQLIFDFGKTYSRVAASSNLESASEQNLISTKQDLILNTYVAYFSYLQALRLNNVSIQTLQQADEHLRQAEAFYKVGTKPKLDVLEAQTDKENARVNLLNAENNLKVTKLQLENVLSIKLEDNFVLKDNLEVKKDSVDESSALKIAMSNRPELIASNYVVEANKSFVTSAWTSNLPTINATGGYSWRNYVLDTKFPDSWNIGLNLSLPIFTGFAIDAQVQEAKANLSNAEAQNNLIVQSITLDVRQQYSNLEIAQSKIAATKSLLTQAEETLKTAEGRYDQAVGSQIEVTDARIGFYNAQVLYIQSLYDYQVAYVRLQRATGILK
jgi:outer membrane protein